MSKWPFLHKILFFLKAGFFSSALQVTCSQISVPCHEQALHRPQWSCFTSSITLEGSRASEWRQSCLISAPDWDLASGDIFLIYYCRLGLAGLLCWTFMQVSSLCITADWPGLRFDVCITRVLDLFRVYLWFVLFLNVNRLLCLFLVFHHENF